VKSQETGEKKKGPLSFGSEERKKGISKLPARKEPIPIPGGSLQEKGSKTSNNKEPKEIKKEKQNRPASITFPRKHVVFPGRKSPAGGESKEKAGDLPRQNKEKPAGVRPTELGNRITKKEGGNASPKGKGFWNMGTVRVRHCGPPRGAEKREPRSKPYKEVEQIGGTSRKERDGRKIFRPGLKTGY